MIFQNRIENWKVLVQRSNQMHLSDLKDFQIAANHMWVQLKENQKANLITKCISNTTVPLHVSPHFLPVQYWWTHGLFSKQYGKFDEPATQPAFIISHILHEVSHHNIMETTSCGIVAENKSVWRCFGTAAMIFSISLRKPMSKRWSASSRTKTLTPISRVANPAVFSIWSFNLPGVATRIWIFIWKYI